MQESLACSKTLISREKERSEIRAVQMDKLVCILGIRRMDRVLNVLVIIVQSD